jgi:protein involved in polysaccharide export with SLBB domain
MSVFGLSIRRICVGKVFLYLAFFLVFPVCAATEGEAVKEYTILPGDTLMVTVYNDEELSEGVERLVGEKGVITIPYVDVDVVVRGLSLEECKREIIRRLKEEEMYHEPNLDVSISRFGRRAVQITGYVEKPGEVLFTDGDPMTIEEAIAKAGGFARDKRVNRNRVKLTRTDESGRKNTIEVRVEDIMEGKAKPVYLEPNDIIEVTERFL